MLPRSEQFKKFLYQNNISKNNSIIIYDQTGFFALQEFGLLLNTLDLIILEY